MSEQTESITLGPRYYDKLGPIHCGVTRDGFVSVGGEVSDIEDGQEVTFDRAHVRVSRKGDDYVFSKIAR